jgi:hypothetical protein
MSLDDAVAVLDHVASRVTACSMSGLCCGMAYSSYKGYPIFKTSISTSFSFALVSTACFVMERASHVALRRMLSSSSSMDDEKSIVEGGMMPSSNAAMTTRLSFSSPIVDNAALHYGSHALGGLLGGGVVGFLFQGKPLAGAMLVTPMMLIVGKIEALLDEYRTERMGQLMAERDDIFEDEKSASP